MKMEENEDFAEYVKRYAASRGISIAEALTHEIVNEYGRYLNG